MGQCLSCKEAQASSTRPLPAPGDSGRSLNLFPEHPPPPPEAIIKNISQYRSDAELGAYAWPKGDKDDPVKALYRLYEYILLDINTEMRNIIEYFWNHPSWKVQQIPDPCDQDPSRYAVLACITELLVLAFNRKIEIGAPRNGRGLIRPDELEYLRNRPRIYEAAPEWAKRVPALKTTLVIPTTEDDIATGFDDDRVSEPFKEKNILIIEPHIYFI